MTAAGVKDATATSPLHQAMRGGEATHLAAVTPPPLAAHQPDRGTGVLGSHLTAAQIELIKSTVMRGASDDEVAVFVYVCNRTGLDPFTKQIHAVKRKVKAEGSNTYEERWAHQVGIDGFRLVADRTGKYDGRLEPEFFDAAGNARKVWLDKVPPRACRIGVLRKGIREPFYVTALWDEYVQKKFDGNPTMQWRDKPTIMLAKCAEAAALRAAFPQELSGVYAPEELARGEESEELSDRELRPVAESRPRTVAPDSGGRQARATEDGDIELLFGSFNGKRVSQLDVEQLTKLVAGWSDPARRAAAEERLGIGAVRVIAATFKAKREAAGEAAVPGPSPYIANLLERERAGERLSDSDLEELRQYRLDQEG